MNLWQDFQTNDGRVIHKWVHYFPIYERHFAWYRNKSLTFLEIGVARGGSLPMWQRYFGPLAKIVGIDIEEKCKAYEAPGIFIRIGDQSDENFLQSVIEEFGIPDVVLDDGSHRMEHVAKSFQFLYPKMPKNAVYMVEDMHTAYWEEFGGGLNVPGTFINMAKGFIDQLNADHSRGQVTPDHLTRSTFGISFYDSVVVLEKGEVWRKEAVRVGRKPLFGA
jgi:cephalosporin hydroxylase